MKKKKKNNILWWIVGSVIVLVLLSIGFIIFGGRLKCEIEGGVYVKSSFGAYCNYPTTDAEQRCDDQNQCQGYCKYDPIVCTTTPCLQGKCSSQTKVGGCVDMMINGQKETLC